MLTGQLVLFQGINRFNNHPGLIGISHLFLWTASRFEIGTTTFFADRIPTKSGRPPNFCGPDGTRTRDLRRDRAAF